MTENAEVITPLESYVQQKDAIDSIVKDISVEISDAKAHLRTLEGLSAMAQQDAGKLSDEFVKNMHYQGGIYEATFSLECDTDFELPRDLRQATAADFIARQLIKLDDVLDEFEYPTSVLIVDNKRGTFTENPSSLSYPRDADLVRHDESWIEATLVQTTGTEGLNIKTQQKDLFFEGVLTSIVSIELPIISRDKLWSNMRGMDHDTWLEGPYLNSHDYEDSSGSLNIYHAVSERETQITISPDEIEPDKISGIFVGGDVICKIFECVEKSQELSLSAPKLREMLALRGIDV
jgi:hypothetical protein